MNGFLFVCEKCGQLCFTRKDFWDTPSRQSDSTDNPEKQNPIFILKQRDLSQAENFIDFIKSADCPFPLCPVCCQMVIQRLISRKKFVENASAFYSRLDIPCKSIFAETLVEEVSKNQKEINDLMQIADEFSDRKIDEILHRGPRQSKKEVEVPKIEKQRKRGLKKRVSSYIVNPLLSRYPIEPFSSLIMSGTWRIYCLQHYGTINNARLGNNCPDEVPYEEIAQAFMFLSHLILFICRISSVDAKSIVINCHVTLSKDDKYYPLTPMDLTKKKTIVIFNDALNIFMEICSRIFVSLKELDNGTVPFDIDLNQHTIGSESYLFTKKKSREWTKAMKKLLRNFKYIQYFSMKKYMSNART